MTKTKVGFNQTQIKQLVDIVRTILREEVPPMIDQKLKPILNCPTIKKELNQNNK